MRSLAQWLAYIESAHPDEIDMGLSRIRQVFSNLGLVFPITCFVTVAGTNGKGTTCRFIEQACLTKGYSVGVYSSPHILQFNERIRINGKDASDQILCNAFEKVYQATYPSGNGANNAQTENDKINQTPITLTYFEYATLCALAVFAEQQVDICLLEVGLGGRLDATNIIDADISVITSIGLDHQSYLGDTKELIAAEKAGIFKPAQHVVIGYADMQNSVKDALHAKQLDTKQNVALLRNRDFGEDWLKLSSLAYTANNEVVKFDVQSAKIPKQNVMTAIATLMQIARVMQTEKFIRLNTSIKPDANLFLLPQKSIQNLITQVQMPGRCQIIKTQPLTILDVAHNEDSAEYLVKKLEQFEYNRCHIVIGMLKDKNIEATIDRLAQLNANWYCVDLPTNRGEKAIRLSNAVKVHQQTAKSFENLKMGLQEAMRASDSNDMILVVGSFVLASLCLQEPCLQALG